MTSLAMLAARFRVLLLLAAVMLSGCATVSQTVAKPPAPPRPIPTYGGAKRVVISKTDQILRAYDGDKLVFESRVSTGEGRKRTPSGRFRVQSKSRMHYSSLYENAPMPYSVQFSGNYFIHGYTYVPPFPASHGCIRLPLRGEEGNPAARFYEWIRIGTPVRVTGDWKG